MVFVDKAPGCFFCVEKIIRKKQVTFFFEFCGDEILAEMMKTPFSRVTHFCLLVQLYQYNP